MLNLEVCVLVVQTGLGFRHNPYWAWKYLGRIREHGND